MNIPTSFNRMGLALMPTPEPTPPTPPTPVDENDYLRFTANTDNSAVKLTKIGVPTAVTLEYSTDKQNWNNYAIDNVIELNEDDVVYFRGDNTTFSTYNNAYYKFSLSGTLKASGNVMSLVDKTCEKTTVSNYMFTNLFQSCSGLLTPPSLPATTIGTECYRNMFYNCADLQYAPELPATTMKYNCYMYMFSGCSKLTKAMDELPATTLAEQCYVGMFANCKNLVYAPLLPATTLSSLSYAYMFNGCETLSSITVDFETWQNTTNWVNGVASNGVFRCPSTLSAIYGNSNIPTNWRIEHNDYLCFTANTANSAVKLAKVGSPSAVTLEYSTDKRNWTNYTIDDIVSLDNVGDKVYFRGNNNTFSQSNANYYNFVMSGSINADGNVMSLVDKTGMLSAIPSDYCFKSLFEEVEGYPHLCKAPLLPAATLTDHCYASMFKNCANLIEMPELPAVTLDEHCYDMMFTNCTSLTGYTTLPASALHSYSYSHMFRGCTSLSSAGTLAFTTFIPSATNSCDNMFKGCTALSTAPSIKADSLATNCYKNMFSGCSSLNKVDVNFTTWDSYSTANWLSGVALTGNFCCKSTLPVINDVSHIPNGWTVVHNDYFYVEALSPNSSVGIGYSGTLPVVNEGEGEWVDTGEGEWVYPEPEWVYPEPEWDPDANDGEGDWIQGDPYEVQGDPEWVPAEPEWVPAEPEQGVGINMEYSTDLVNWSTLDIFGMTAVSLPNVGDRVYFRGNNVTFTTAEINSITDDGYQPEVNPDQNIDSAVYYFTGADACKIGGNLLSICDGSSMSNSYACNFSKLFSGLGVVDASDLKLPSFTDVNQCKYMFAQTPLSAAPALPATSAYYDQYKGFFQECTSLTVAPAIHITINSNTYASLEDMFNGCTSLSSVTVDFQNWENGWRNCYNELAV